MFHRHLPRMFALSLFVLGLAAIAFRDEIFTDIDEKTDDDDGSTGDDDQSEAPGSVVDAAAAAGQFGIFCMAIKNAGLVETLEGEGPFTVFAPTDDAFGELGESLDDLLNDTEALRTALSYHVVTGQKLTSKDLTGQSEAENLAGDTLAFEAEDGVTINGAAVVEADLEAGNGVLHGIGKVLVPKPKKKKSTKKKNGDKKDKKDKKDEKDENE